MATKTLQGSTLVKLLQKFEEALASDRVESVSKNGPTVPVAKATRVEAIKKLKAARVAMAGVCQQNVLGLKVSDN